MMHVIISFSCSYSFFPITFIIKCNVGNERNPASCPFSTLMDPFPHIAFINEEARGYINEEAIDAVNERAIGPIIGPRNSSSCFFYFMFSCFSDTIN